MFLSAVPLAISLMKRTADFVPALAFLVHALAVVMIAQPSTAFAPAVIAICTVIFISRYVCVWVCVPHKNKTLGHSICRDPASLGAGSF